jgi:hypothetical protein
MGRVFVLRADWDDNNPPILGFLRLNEVSGKDHLTVVLRGDK